jgi:hypothetical protein
MAVYDCRKEGREPGSVSFPCNVRIIDPQTGERFPATVFCLQTSPAKVGRFVLGPDGTPLASPHRKKRMIDDGRGGKKLEIYYERQELWEFRPWVALRLNPDGSTGEVIAKSEDAA